MSPRPAPAIAWKSFSDSPDRASARLRSFLPCRYMQEAGWRCEIFEPANLASYELVIFQKAYDEESIALAKSLAGRGVKTVFDLSDNHFYNPHDLPVLRERTDRLCRMIETVDAVSVSTAELMKLIGRADVVVIDDVIEAPQGEAPPSAFSGKQPESISSARPLRVVWYGNHPGLLAMPKVLPHLERLHARTPIELTVISDSEELFRRFLSEVSFPALYQAWRLDTCAHTLAQHDVCIIPVDINPYTLCKSNNRLTFSVLMGVPVIADAIPSYEEFRDFVLFADWQNSLRTYAEDKELRRRHVEAGQHYIRSKYNKERVVSQWSALFERMLGKERGRA